MLAFTYTALPGRVVFGAGVVRQLAEEVSRLGLSRVLVLSTPNQREQAEELSSQLGELSAGVYAEAVMHIPVAVANAAVAHARAVKADGTLAVGGGSTIGLGKAIALQTDLPVIAVPTTYSGSEMTPIWGLTEQGMKRTGRDSRVLPRCVLYDPELTVNLPPSMSATSGMNAIAHCVEALYAQDANPVISLYAEEGIRALAQGLPVVVQTPQDLNARAQALYGAWLAGAALGAVGMALHHKLCHTLGGSFNLPHAEAHTVMIPYVTAFNRAAAPEAMSRIARALGSTDAAQGLYDLVLRLQAPHALSQIGMQEADLDQAAEIATRNPYYNPREITRAGIRELLQAAYDGQRPG